MTQNAAAAAALQNPLTGLKKPQVRQLAGAVQRLATLSETVLGATKRGDEARFTIKAGYSDKDTASAVLAARDADKVRQKAEDQLRKLIDGMDAKPAIKAALTAFQGLEKAAAAGDPAARNLLAEVSADLAIAGTGAPARGKSAEAGVENASADVELADALLNRIVPGRAPRKARDLNIPELTEVARGLAEDAKKRRQPNEFIQKPPVEQFPASLLARYTVRGSDVVDKRTESVAFVDAGKELRAKGDVGQDVIDAMLDTAETRGWAPIKVLGTKAFKAAVWMEAASRGIDVSGYTPSPQELAAAEHNRALSGRVNAIAGESPAKAMSKLQNAVDPLVKAFVEAGTSRQQAKAAKEHPQLANAFALVTAFEKSVARPGMPQAASKDFVEQFKGLVADRLQEGKPLPTVTLAEPEQQKSQPQMDQER